jgi:hypothetical protein
LCVPHTGWKEVDLSIESPRLPFGFLKQASQAVQGRWPSRGLRIETLVYEAEQLAMLFYVIAILQHGGGRALLLLCDVPID